MHNSRLDTFFFFVFFWEGMALIGLLFLATIALWIFTCVWLSKKVGNLITDSRWQSPTKVFTLIVLLSSPFVDEVIGKYQFEKLCKLNGIESADVSKAQGRKVKVEYGDRVPVQGTILPIQESDVSFRDMDTDEILIRHKNYYASGGWLMRYTWLSMGSNHTMLFDGSTCDIRIEQKIFKANSITFLYK